jgi:hypothetical protein
VIDDSDDEEVLEKKYHPPADSFNLGSLLLTRPKKVEARKVQRHEE